MHFRDEARSEDIFYIGMHYSDAKLSEWDSDELARSLALQSDRTYVDIDCYMYKRTDIEHKLNVVYKYIYMYI